MISSLVPLKMMGLEDTYFMRIQRLKIAELEAWTGIRVIQMHQAIESKFPLRLLVEIVLMWNSLTLFSFHDTGTSSDYDMETQVRR